MEEIRVYFDEITNSYSVHDMSKEIEAEIQAAKDFDPDEEPDYFDEEFPW